MAESGVYSSARSDSDCSVRAGTNIDVFHRFGINPNTPQWLATPTRYAGTRSPRFGRSDGWQRALDAGPAPPSEPLWALDTPTGGFGATFFGDDA